MTILAGIVSENAVYIGTDSLWLWDTGYIKEIPGGKFLDIPDEDVLIVGCGQEGNSQALEELLRNKTHKHLLDIETKYDVQILARSLYEHLKDLGVGSAKENELPNNEAGYLIAVAGIPKIWLIDEDYSVLEFSDHIVLGSGSMFAEAAMWVATEHQVPAYKTLELGLRAACKFSPTCGGELVIKEVSCGDG